MNATERKLFQSNLERLLLEFLQKNIHDSNVEVDGIIAISHSQFEYPFIVKLNEKWSSDGRGRRSSGIGSFPSGFQNLIMNSPEKEINLDALDHSHSGENWLPLVSELTSYDEQHGNETHIEHDSKHALSTFNPSSILSGSGIGGSQHDQSSLLSNKHVTSSSATQRNHTAVDNRLDSRRLSNDSDSINRPYRRVRYLGKSLLVCITCGKLFNSHSNFKVHYRVHSGEKPYKCEVCLRSFSQSGSLTIHRRVHTGEKPFICTVCHRGFICSSNLRHHKKSHTKFGGFSGHNFGIGGGIGRIHFGISSGASVSNVNSASVTSGLRPTAANSSNITINSGTIDLNRGTETASSQYNTTNLTSI